MRLLQVLYTVILLCCSCAYTKNPLRRETHLLQRGKITDTTSYVYELPYPKGVTHTLVQGYFTHFTHKRRAALDFKMPVASAVCAARDGIVMKTKSDGNRGGIQSADRRHANYIVIRHADSSYAGYWHLQRNGVLVNTGDTVKAGQLIARSGNTGYTYFPHLHFIVWAFDKNGRFIQVPARFRTKNGFKYLRAIRRYTNP